MELSKGCFYCDNLKHEAMTKFECKKNEKLKLENAGACMTADFNGKKIIVENCPDFTAKGQ